MLSCEYDEETGIQKIHGGYKLKDPSGCKTGISTYQTGIIIQNQHVSGAANIV